MPKFASRSLKFRIRGFAAADGHEELAFGSDPAPQNPDGSAMTLLFDQDVQQNETVTDHVEPAPPSA